MADLLSAPVKSGVDRAPAGTDAPATARSRSSVRAVALPNEHGGWGLTAEPIVLGLVVAPSWAGGAIGAAAALAFLARTPTKIALGDLRRRRVLPRTRLAGTIALVELALLVALALVGTAAAAGPVLVPLIAVAPLLAVELAYDIRARGRRLVPELAGSVGISGVATMIALAAGATSAVAFGLWFVLAGRAIAAIPWVREQVRRIHGRAPNRRPLLVSDAVALASAVAAVALDFQLIGGALAVATVVALQRLSELRPIASAKVIGISQTVLGLLVVVATAVGIALTGGIQ